VCLAVGTTREGCDSRLIASLRSVAASVSGRSSSAASAVTAELGQERDHVECLPKWRVPLTFTQVKAFPPEVCKAVGSPIGSYAHPTAPCRVKWPLSNTGPARFGLGTATLAIELPCPAA